MSRVDHVAHAMSVAVLVTGGVFAKSIVLNWVVGPALVVMVGSLTLFVESRLARQRSSR